MVPSFGRYQENGSLPVRILNPQTSPEKVWGGSKHRLTRYLEDSGCLGRCQCQFPEACVSIFFYKTNEHQITKTKSATGGLRVSFVRLGFV